MRLRSEPSKTSQALLPFPHGGVAVVVAAPEGCEAPDTCASNSWYKIRYRQAEGYVRAAHLQNAELVGEELALRHERVIVVAREQQHIEVYQHGELLLISAVTTGRPALATPLGRTRVGLRDRSRIGDPVFILDA